METKGRVFLVGAGCGSAELITMRGAELIKSCTALVYDDLIAPELLALAPETAEKIYMGKRSGRHSASQEEISQTLIELAKAGHTVVRLKGGDPFVFGRGGEELLALMDAGIACEVVPGISSAIAIPSAAGIPVTHRRLSRSFHVVTAHTADSADGLPEDLDTLAKLHGTLVFLMGLSKLDAIAERLMLGGMAPETPAAVLSGGNSPNPYTLRAPLSDIARRAKEENLKSPAVIVIGAVAALELRSDSFLPLSGKRIGVTGTAAVADKLISALRTLGAETVVAERSEITELETDFDYTTLADGQRKLLVFTSANGVRLFFAKLREARVDLRALACCRFAVIGAATGKVLADYGIYADLCPEEYNSEALCDGILAHYDGSAVYIFRSAQGSAVLNERLSGRCEVHDIHTYTVTPAETGAVDSLDYLCFLSAGGLRLYMDKYGAIPKNCVPVCIGAVTRNELSQHYSGKLLTAPEATVDGIVSAILADAESE